jgi:hypothetical protein
MVNRHICVTPDAANVPAPSAWHRGSITPVHSLERSQRRRAAAGAGSPRYFISPPQRSDYAVITPGRPFSTTNEASVDTVLVRFFSLSMARRRVSQRAGVISKHT